LSYSLRGLLGYIRPLTSNDQDLSYLFKRLLLRRGAFSTLLHTVFSSINSKMSALGSSRLLNLPGGDIGGHNLTWTGTLTTILTAVTIAWTLYLLSLAIYRIYFHPLAKYPGPLLGKLTAWNAFWPAVRGQATLARHSWTQKYGRVVRIAPNELLFGDNQTVKDIYGQMSNACPKDAEFYGPFTVTGARNVFNSYDRIEHAAIRRLLSHAFSMNEIKKTQIRIIPIIERCLKIIEHSPQPVNFWEKFSYMFLDIVSDLSFDRCFNCLEGEMLKEAHDADAVQNISAIRGWVPFIVYVPSSFVQEAVRARPRLIKFARQQIDEFRARSAAGTVQEGSLLKRVVEAEDEETGRKMSDLELMENAIVFLQAGSETSLSALCYLLYEVDRRPAIKDRLVQEIREAFPDTHVFPDFDTADKLVGDRFFPHMGPC